MSPPSGNEFGIEFDASGFCAFCHQPVAEFESSDHLGMPIVKRLLPIFRFHSVLLDDGSQMTVTLCESCQETFSPEQAGPLMESVINGWAFEVEKRLLHWDVARKIKHLKVYTKRYILANLSKPWPADTMARLTTPRPKQLRVSKEVLR